MSQIRGYVDRITQSSIQGWIANAASPEHLEQVVCEGAHGSTVAFAPYLPRADVCNALRIQGRFGFAIPLAAIQWLGPVVTIRDRHGAILEGGAHVDISSSAPSDPDRATWVVLHIQKTAGTSLRSALSQAVDPAETLFLYNDGLIGISNDELAAMPLSQRASLRLVMGHTFFGVADMLPGKAEYVTFLRQPEARIRSHLRHHLAHRSILHVDGVEASIPIVVQEGLTDEFDNLMVRMITGASVQAVPLGEVDERLVQRALHHIRTRFRFVGLTERSQLHYPALCRIMGIEGRQLPKENVRCADMPDCALPALDWSRILRRNRFDQMLYDRVMQEGLCGRDLSLSEAQIAA